MSPNIYTEIVFPNKQEGEEWMNLHIQPQYHILRPRVVPHDSTFNVDYECILPGKKINHHECDSKFSFRETFPCAEQEGPPESHPHSGKVKYVI